MSRGIRARIDRSALRHNLRRARKSAPGSRIIAVIKADGYGHGMIEVARSLIDADAFGVESADEAVRLRTAGFNHDILLLSGFHEHDDLDLITRSNLCPVIHDSWQVEAVCEGAPAREFNVWVKIDSGMHRIGFDPEDVPRVMEKLESSPGVRIAGLMSHLANADDLSKQDTRRQCRRFLEAAAGFSYPLSLANSPGVLGWPETHLDWTRPGMMLYGCSPLKNRTEQELDLRPAMTLEARIIAIRSVQKGEAIGYGSTWRCDSKTRVGVVACGYGDGYPRHAPNGTPVHVKGRVSRILGRVSMDLTSIDLSQIEEARIWDWVELWGKDMMASSVALHAGTIPYELVSGITARVPRIYES